MSTILKDDIDFINKHHRLLQSNDFDAFFEQVEKYTAVGQVANRIARVFQESGIDCLKYMSYIPMGYFSYDTMVGYTIPKNIHSLHRKCFEGSDLHKIVIPSHVEDIRDSAFQACYFLNMVECEEGLEYLGENAFFSCEDLKYVELPASLKEIGYGCFRDCENLVRVRYRGKSEDWQYIKNIDAITDGSYVSSVVCVDGIIFL